MRIFHIVVCVAVFGLATLMAQTSRGDLVVDVPFAFSVSGHNLPAGHYMVKPVNDLQIRIWNTNSRAIGFYVATQSALRGNAQGSKLEFHRYGEKYFLRSIWITGNQTGREIAPSRAERELTQHSSMELAVVRPAH